MPIPDYETIMLPLLKFSSDANEHSSKEAIESLSKSFKLTKMKKINCIPPKVSLFFTIERIGH